MNLETKLGMSTGGLLVAMVLSAGTVSLRMAESNRLSEQVMSGRLPLILGIRDVTQHLTQSTRELGPTLLANFPASRRPEARAAQERELQASEDALKNLAVAVERLNLGADRARLEEVKVTLADLVSAEQRTIPLAASGRPEDIEAATHLLQKILPAVSNRAVCFTISIALPIATLVPANCSMVRSFS